MRIRGELIANVAAVTDTFTSAGLFWGVGLQDFQVTGEFENPFSHSFSDDWMWWGGHYFTNIDASTAGLQDPRNAVTGAIRLPIDIRSKRRCDPSDDLVAVFVNSPPNLGANDVAAAFLGRVLIQES